ncbi:hypothetical protein SKAU_G00272500 [Synaphobranchus kaupii]|uniref:Uncharacterized protein n=1 Tax=Synaphobranchus kaupii TaxID=118154 RepID=A0A9Q1IQR1_SYNKA|nr:hypothetical protein SKAU_G00272500 [Synaphobranchus kaupii]
MLWWLQALQHAQNCNRKWKHADIISTLTLLQKTTSATQWSKCESAHLRPCRRDQRRRQSRGAVGRRRQPLPDRGARTPLAPLISPGCCAAEPLATPGGSRRIAASRAVLARRHSAGVARASQSLVSPSFIALRPPPTLTCPRSQISAGIDTVHAIGVLIRASLRRGPQFSPCVLLPRTRRAVPGLALECQVKTGHAGGISMSSNIKPGCLCMPVKRPDRRRVPGGGLGGIEPSPQRRGLWPPDLAPSRVTLRAV